MRHILKAFRFVWSVIREIFAENSADKAVGILILSAVAFVIGTVVAIALLGVATAVFLAFYPLFMDTKVAKTPAA